MERKSFAIFYLAIFLSIIFSLPSYANDEDVILVRTVMVVDDSPNPQLDPVGNRLPSKSVMVAISKDGVDIPSMSELEVLSYDIVIDGGKQVLSFYDDKCFVSTLMSMSEAVEVRINFDGYSLRGWVHL